MAAALLLAGMAARGEEGDDLGELSLEELMELRVTTVSRREAPVSEAAAAITVITREDIRRSGATTIADALRLAPGLAVGRLNANTWAISARGFNDEFANKMLVLVDGRSVYTPLYSGVFWDKVDLLLEDVAHIEVIRGPAGTLWGANAVNGIINIVTRDSFETEGGLITTAGGTEERAVGGVRFGAINGRLAARVWAKGFYRDRAALPAGTPGSDAWGQGSGGFRVDWRPRPGHSVMLDSRGYGGWSGIPVELVLPDPPFGALVDDAFRVAGGHVLGRWRYAPDPGSEVMVQAWYDRVDRRGRIFEEHRDTVDLEYLQRATPGGGPISLVWGLGYRGSGDQTVGSLTLSLDPASEYLHLYSAFTQAELELLDRRLRLIGGAKLEHNAFTGFELQPNVRAAWIQSETQTLWAAVSRAVRTPSRAATAGRITSQVVPGAPAFAVILGNPDFDVEALVAFEAGYRVAFEQVAFDVAAFVNSYDRLRSIEPVAPLPGTVATFMFENRMEGSTRGIEMAGSWQATRRWRLHATYSLLHMTLTPAPGSADTTSAAEVGRSPRHQGTLRSLLDLPRGLALDFVLRAVDRLPAFDVPAYATLDARLAWRRGPFELAVVGQNLLQSQHLEFGPTFFQVQPSAVQRGVYGRLTWTN